MSHLEEEDIIDNANILINPNGSSEANPSLNLSLRFEAAANKDIIHPEEYRILMRGLNAKIVMYHRKWCKHTVLALKQNRKVTPCHVFVSGPGGVGKSHN